MSAGSPSDGPMVALVNLPYLRRLYGGRFRRLFSHYLPSLTLASLAGALPEGARVEAIDAPDGEDGEEALLERIVRGEPDVVGFPCATPMFPAAAAMAARVGERLPRAILVCGGHHPSALPERCLAESVFDVAVVGEGERTLREIVEAAAGGEAPGERGARLASIPGIVFRGVGDGRTRATPPRSPEDDLDRLPLPAFHLLDFRNRPYNRLYHRRVPAAVLEASRGCPFRCSFCSKSVHGETHRTKSPERVLAEFEYSRGLGFREVYLVDDSLLTNRRWASRLFDVLASAAFDQPWSCHARIDEPDEELLRAMARAGCHSIAYGIESFDPMLADVRSKTGSLPFLAEQVARTRRAGMRALGMFILGLPEETEESLRKSIDLAPRLGLDSAKWTVAIPFPGTRMFDDLKKSGRVLSEGWDLYRIHGDPDLVFRHPRIRQGAIRRAYDRAYLRFYLRPGFAARALARWVSDRVGPPRG